MPDDQNRTSFEGVDWQLTRGIAQVPGQPATARFVDGTLSGQGPVNRYRASYTRAGDEVRISPPSGTRMAGPSEAMSAEDAYFRLLEASTSAAVGDGGRRLDLKDASGTTVLAFEPAPSGLLALDGSWAIRAVARGHSPKPVRAGSEAALTFDAAGGTVSGSTGINRLNGKAEVHDGRLRFGPLMLTRMAGEPEAMDEESALVDALDDVTGFAVDGDRLRLLDADGDTKVGLERKGSGSAAG
jgi:heat shock protein HslJ